MVIQARFLTSPKYHYLINLAILLFNKLYINNFGKYNGGANKKHSEKSLHYVGRAVDLRPMMKTKKVKNWYVGQSNYSTEKNIELFQMAIDLSNSNTYGVKLNNMILNDDALISHFSGVKNIGGGNLVIKTAGHDNHIHWEFELPDDVRKSINSNKRSDLITSNGVAGTVSTETVSRPNKATKLQSLGKI